MGHFSMKIMPLPGSLLGENKSPFGKGVFPDCSDALEISRQAHQVSLPRADFREW